MAARSEAERETLPDPRSERTSHTLTPTALVHETFLRLFPTELRCESRVQLFTLLAKVMRRILIDSARRRQAQKRTPPTANTLERQFSKAEIRGPDEYLLALDDVLVDCEIQQPDLAQVVELRFFAGYSVDETAEVLEISAPTVKRRWRLAKALLHQAIEDREGGDDGAR